LKLFSFFKAQQQNMTNLKFVTLFLWPWLVMLFLNLIFLTVALTNSEVIEFEWIILHEVRISISPAGEFHDQGDNV
jgi:hypothetical protein